MSERVHEVIDSIPAWAYWLAKRARLVLAAAGIGAVLAIVGVIAVVNIGSLVVTGDTFVDVSGNNNRVTIPRAPDTITPETIACKGLVLSLRGSAGAGYTAKFTVMGEDGYPTNYFLSLSLLPDGLPVDQASVSWRHEDGVEDASDSQFPVNVPVSETTRDCLAERAR